jgi:hypothetical protein
MIKSYQKKLGSLALVSLLGSCAASIDEPPSLVSTPEVEYKTKKVESAVSIIPDWYKQLPEEENMIYSSGSATAPDLQLSVDIAVMNAKTVLADRINGKLDSMTKQFVAKMGTNDADTSVLEELEKVTKNVIASVDVAGYKVKEMEVYPTGVQYRSFVLLEYSDKEASKIIMNRMKKDRMVYSKLRSTNAFKELEASVNNSKNEDEAQSLSNIENELSKISEPQPLPELNVAEMPAIGPDNTWVTE